MTAHLVCETQGIGFCDTFADALNDGIPGKKSRGWWEDMRKIKAARVAAVKRHRSNVLARFQLSQNVEGDANTLETQWPHLSRKGGLKQLLL